MSEVSQDKLAIMDIKKIRVVPDAGSFSGYSIMAMDQESQGLAGIPASPFEVVMWHEIERLRKEKEKLRMFIEKVYDIGGSRSLAGGASPSTGC